MDTDFAELIRRVRIGDDAASQEFVERFSPELARAVRVRFAEPMLQSHVDSEDICQSVFLDFFLRVRLGQYELAEPRDLLRLLTTMARHKLLNHARHAKVRKVRQTADPEHDPLPGIADCAETPSTIATAKEILEHAGKLLTTDEREVAEHRRAGLDWDEIATLTGTTAEAARKRLARACDRVSKQLGLHSE